MNRISRTGNDRLPVGGLCALARNWSIGAVALSTQWMREALACAALIGAALTCTAGNAWAATHEAAASDASAARQQAERSREAGLLTDWHLLGRYGRRDADFARCFAPERRSAKEAAKEAAAANDAAPQDDAAEAVAESAAANGGAGARPEATSEGRTPHRDRRARRYELVFPDGTFVLPKASARHDGVFYAVSRVYLSSGGEWNLYLESAAEALVFVDGVRVLASVANQTGVKRETVHAASGFHDVMIKFVAKAAPFRVAILPPNSGSRRKNNTPYLHGPENMNARVRGVQVENPDAAGYSDSTGM